jgi:hypothetical protein
LSTIHIALDESGDFTFNRSASIYYVFTAAWTYDPAPLAYALTDLRCSLLKQGKNIVSFHACEDEQSTRNAVVDLLCAHDGWHFAAAVVEKPKVNPSIRDPYTFYPTFASMLFRFIFRGCLRKETTHVIALTDTLPLQRNREPVEKAFKTVCRSELGRIPFQVYHHPRASNPWIQVVDYCCWAVYRKWHHGDDRTYQKLACRLKARELEVFRRGDQTVYY